MPKIVKSYGVQMSEDVFRIPDEPKRKKQAGLNEEGETGDTVLLEEAGEEHGDISSGESVSGPSPLESEIVQSAMAHASRIIEEAIVKAGEESREIIAKASHEAERLKSEAGEIGRREAYTQAMDEIRDIALHIENLVASMEAERAGFEAEYEEQVKWFSAEIASKVLSKKVEADDGVLIDMVENAMQGMKNEAWVRVDVANDMRHLIDKLQQAYQASENIEINPIDAEPGTVHIETKSGIVDASMQTQLENLKAYFGTVSTEN